MHIKLSPSTVVRLKQIAQKSKDGKQVRRAQALLWLHEGKGVTEVAKAYGTTRQSVYSLAHNFLARHHEPVAQRLQDRPHLGRKPLKFAAIAALVEEVIETDPRQLGYRCPCWTAPLLRLELRRRKQLEVAERTVRRCLRALRYRYKRARYVFSRQSPYWHQAKGG